VVGNAQANHIRLKKSAVVHGNISCKSFEMDIGAVLVGKLNSGAFDDEDEGGLAIDEEGFIIDDEYEEDKKFRDAKGEKKIIT
jgi:cytoskeletal protein CcmA (bactofilin family)